MDNIFSVYPLIFINLIFFKYHIKIVKNSPNPVFRQLGISTIFLAGAQQATGLMYYCLQYSNVLLYYCQVPNKPLDYCTTIYSIVLYYWQVPNKPLDYCTTVYSIVIYYCTTGRCPTSHWTTTPVPSRGPSWTGRSRQVSLDIVGVYWSSHPSLGSLVFYNTAVEGMKD